jgi:hypothetical protein
LNNGAFAEYILFLKPTSMVMLLLVCVHAQYVFSEDKESSESTRRTAGQAIVDGLLGSAEALTVNGLVLGSNIIYDKFTGKQAWATPTAESVRYNFTTPWEWETTDDFIVNQIGHPTQAALYYTAGRVNRFGYYESALFSALGSFTFESIGESNHASINDFITTTITSLSGGEIFYRLYLEACAAGVPAPIAFFINPMAGFHRLITGWKPPNYGRNLYQLRADVGMGYARTYSSMAINSLDKFTFRGILGNAGLSIIYGNPFEQESKTPFNHFELDALFGIDNTNYMDIRLITDGYLFSFSPVYTDTDKMSTGLSLHYDFLCLGEFDYGRSSVNLFSNALDWTVKYQHLFSPNMAFQMKLHFGFTFMGAAGFYNPNAGRDHNNYGGGLNNKILLGFEHKTLGKLELSVFNYVIWSYPDTSAISRGTSYWIFADIAYSHAITKHFSVGIADSFAVERGMFGNIPNARKKNNEVRLFVSWNL